VGVPDVDTQGIQSRLVQADSAELARPRGAG
jgi:hypothetical protein